MGLNAPDGAGCSLTEVAEHLSEQGYTCLNAPDGAGCSLTINTIVPAAVMLSLNAPDGAGCSLTHGAGSPTRFRLSIVLMHLMVLGAP